jgi:hypothetical protein
VINEPTEEELKKIPMEQPPTWYENVADFTWKATKVTAKATGSVLKATGQAMKAIGEAERQNGYLRQLQKNRQQGYVSKNTVSTTNTNLKPPTTPDWMKKEYNKPKPRPTTLSKPSPVRYIVRQEMILLKNGKTNIHHHITTKPPKYSVYWCGKMAKMTKTVVATSNSKDVTALYHRCYKKLNKNEWDPGAIDFKH